MDDLDNIDRNMLAILQSDGRITVTDLAQKVGLSKTPCLVRMRRLEERGIVKGYGAIIDPERVDLGHIAFVQVSLSDTRSEALADFNDRIAAISEIEECHMIAGNFDYLLKVRSRNIGAFRRFLGETLSILPHVARTSTFIVMEAVKDR
ncbi:MAG: Lrp/AsnC ligand binding domain-containing protein [Pseudomonadota bacterium]